MQQPPTGEDYKKAIKAAVHIYTGSTIKQAAAAALVDYGKLRKWKMQPWWRDIVLEAEKAYLGKLAGKSRKVLEKTLNRGLHADASMTELREATAAAKWLLERRDDQFKTQQHVVHQHLNSPARALEGLSIDQLRALVQTKVIEVPADAPNDNKLLEAEIIDADIEAVEVPEESIRSAPEESESDPGPGLPPGVHVVTNA